jgi:hypothetical protein
MLYKGVEINSLNSYSGKYLYRGSTIANYEIEKIKEYKSNGKLSTVVVFSKAFLSFSEDKEKANYFLNKALKNKVKKNLLGCLYILENDNKNLHESNADIQTLSFYPDEKEILFFPGSSFIIKDIKEINENKIEIILNYNGKFKEKYNLIYEDKEKINNLIINNELTKNIAGKELIFLKGGKYLIEKKINKGKFSKIFRGKDLGTDEIVAIKEMKIMNINDSKNEFENLKKEVKYLKEKLSEVKYSVKYRECFQTKDKFYLIEDYYDDDLLKYRKREKKLPPNLIKKIFSQLNYAFKELKNLGIIYKEVKPENILIKYSNIKKTNFDSFLSVYGLYYDSDETNDENDLKLMETNSLYSIGNTIYYLHEGEFYENIKPSIFNFDITIKEDKQLEDLLKKLLKENKDKIISWEEYFVHPFFDQYE